jgi:hypothetical protein
MDIRPTHTAATCPACNTDYDRLPLDYDEDGIGYATFCADHLVSVADGTDQPLHCCPACADECEPMELPITMPPASETRPLAIPATA